VRVTENGGPVRRLKVSPLGASGLRAGVVLAIDASKSMTGAPSEGALAAAQRFLQRRRPNQEVGLVAFNGDLAVLQEPTADGDALRAALDSPPALAYGTRIYDAIDLSVALFRRSKVSTGSVVVLSDGADIGSRESLDAVVSEAVRHHVRVFTVGLRSRAFDSDTQRRRPQESSPRSTRRSRGASRGSTSSSTAPTHGRGRRSRCGSMSQALAVRVPGTWPRRRRAWRRITARCSRAS
jgi:von Willebrand factor type A domain